MQRLWNAELVLNSPAIKAIQANQAFNLSEVDKFSSALTV